MTDLRKAIEPKSDQLNADDLISGPITVKITSVKVASGEQPVSISYEGDDGKPWKPCKSSLRTMITGWNTSDGDKFVGRSVTLKLDSDVTWAGQAVGGIRIDAMSDIEKELKLMLTVSRGKKKPCVIKRLNIIPLKKITDDELTLFTADMEGAESMSDLKLIGAKIKGGGFDKESQDSLSAIYREASKAIRAKD